MQAAQVLPNSFGQGPVAAARLDSGLGLLLTEEGEPTSRLVLQTVPFEGLQAPEPVAVSDASSGTLLPLDLEPSVAGTVLAARQPGGRRAFLYLQSAQGGLQRIETPSWRTLDRRVAVDLFAAPSDGRVWVLAQISGSGAVEVGPLEGTALVTHALSLPDVLAPVRGSVDAAGQVWVAAVHAVAGGGQRILLHEVDPGSGEVLHSETVSQLADETYVDELALHAQVAGFWVVWSSREGDEARLERAWLPLAGLAPVSRLAIEPSPGTSLRTMATAARGEELWTIWAEGPARQSSVWLAVDHPDRGETERYLLRQAATGWPQSLTAVSVEDGAWMAWREVDPESGLGSISIAVLSCSP
jgi:hypothetical protein